MIQFLCLFSLILQISHKEGDCRQLEFWTEKGYIGGIFLISPSELKIYRELFWNILKLLAKEVLEGTHHAATSIGVRPDVYYATLFL